MFARTGISGEQPNSSTTIFTEDPFKGQSRSIHALFSGQMDNATLWY